MKDTFVRVCIAIVLLVLAVVSYGIWGQTGIAAALVAAVLFEGLFWWRVSSKRKRSSKV